MNKTVKTIAFVGLGALGMAMTGCQKEMPVSPTLPLFPDLRQLKIIKNN